MNGSTAYDINLDYKWMATRERILFFFSQMKIILSQNSISHGERNIEHSQSVSVVIYDFCSKTFQIDEVQSWIMWRLILIRVEIDREVW